MLGIRELKKVYNGKKVLITGHSGFKGVYVCVLLKYLGAKVYGYALKEEKGSLFSVLKKELNGKENKYLFDENKYADIRDYNALNNYVKKVKPDFILHMAAQPLVLTAYDEPKYTYEVNVSGTLNLMEAIRVNYIGGKKVSVLNVTTDKVYENNDLKDYAFKENDKLCGHDPYANSKSCSELVTHSYNNSFFKKTKNIKVSTARAGNVIGGGDVCKDRIIPDAYRAIKSGDKLLVRNPNSVRPYQYVIEPIIMYLNIMAYQNMNDKYIGSYNIGPDKSSCLSTKLLIDNFNRAWEKIDNNKLYITYKKINKTSSKEAKFLRLDNNLIKKVFDYKEIFSMEYTMKYTTLVYKEMLHNDKIINTLLAIISSISI